MQNTCKTANGHIDASHPPELNGHEINTSTSAIHEGSQSPATERPGTSHSAPQTNGPPEIPDNGAATLNGDLIAALTEVVSAATQKALEVAFNGGRTQAHGSAALWSSRGGITVKP